MRKSKDVKAMKRDAGVLYRQGKKKEAYAMWEKAGQQRLLQQKKITDEEYAFWEDADRKRK